MDLKVHKRKDASKRNVALLAVLLLAVGLLYYQNIWGFSDLYSFQEGNFEPTPGAPLMSAADESDSAGGPLTQTEMVPAPLAAERTFGAGAPQSKAIATETYREKGPLQEPLLYYGAIAILGLMLLLNIFKVSFQTSAVFDSDIFKTLSSETRVEMLYALQERRKTLSELAAEADISLPGAKQHLEILENKGLIRKKDEGRKWKYYELTDQGKSIIAQRFA